MTTQPHLPGQPGSSWPLSGMSAYPAHVCVPICLGVRLHQSICVISAIGCSLSLPFSAPLLPVLLLSVCFFSGVLWSWPVSLLRALSLFLSLTFFISLSPSPVSFSVTVSLLFCLCSCLYISLCHSLSLHLFCLSAYMCPPPCSHPICLWTQSGSRLY